MTKYIHPGKRTNATTQESRQYKSLLGYTPKRVPCLELINTEHQQCNQIDRYKIYKQHILIPINLQVPGRWQEPCSRASP
jgi:hypothetical protein